MASEFQSSASTPLPPLRRDPAGVQKQLEENLSKAREQEKILEASDPDRSAFWSEQVTQVGLGVAGLAAIALALVMKKRLR